MATTESLFQSGTFSGRNVFVAGGTSGINLAIARRFGELGARPFVISRSQERVDAAVAELATVASAAAGMAADVRDYALSSHKVWGKHLYRSALRWEEDIAAAKEQAAALHPGAWLEVHYEDLLRDPDTTMANVCGFLQIEYSSSVARLQKPAENLGDTSGRTELDTGNIAKWQRELTERQVLRIEEIAFNTMKRTGYETNFATSYRSVDGVRQLAYKLHDWSAIFLFKLRSESGLRRALQNIVSSWRFREHQ
jgi:NAD(P)-dependent dehydrogenase (short-subunit alcohol dehydrogenase family)